MNNNTLILAVIFIASLGIASKVNADAGNTYAGIGFGNASPESSSFSSATGFKVFAGYEINNNIAVEGGYTSLGKMGGPVVLGFSTSLEITGFEVAAVGSIPMSDKFSLFGKLGILAWDFKVNVDGLGSGSTTGTDTFYGLGVEFNTANNLAFRAAWESYTVEGGGTDLLSASVIFSF